MLLLAILAFAFAGFLDDPTTGVVRVRKYGENEACNSTAEFITGGFSSTTYSWPTAATTIRVASGGDANDTAAGSGCQEVTTECLTMALATIFVVSETAGASVSATSSEECFRLQRAFCTRTGAYTGTNAGDIVIESAVTGDDLLMIGAGSGQSEHLIYTVPAGYQGYVTAATFTIDATKRGHFTAWHRPNATDVTTPFTGAMRAVGEWYGLSDPLPLVFPSPLGPFAAGTDLWVMCQNSAVGDIEVSAEFTVDLVPLQ